ncbi:ribosome-binding protein [Mactra antiquata]
MENCIKRWITFMLILVWISMGLHMEIGGPTLLDLRIRFNTNSEEIARSVSAQGAGIFVGALIGGILVDLLGIWKILLVTGSQIIVTATIVSMPYVGSLTMLWVMFFILGTAAGVVNVSGQRIIIELWKDKAPSPMHATHMGFGIGALIAPLIANPFLAVLDYSDSTQTLNGTTSSHVRILQESRVQLAYVTIGAVSAILSLPVLIYPILMCCVKRLRDGYRRLKPEEARTSKRSFREFLSILNPATYANGSLKFGLFVFAMIVLYFVNLVGGEQLFGNFIRTYSVDEMHFPRDEASYLDTIYWGSYTVGRFLGSILSHFIHIKILIVIDAILYLISVTSLNIFSAKFNSKTVLWAFTAGVGFLVAPLFPAGISFTNTQIEVGGVVLTLVMFSSGLSHLLYVWIAGSLYDHYGPQTILYTVQTASVLVFIIVVIFVLVTHRRTDRFQQVRQVGGERDTFNAGDLLYTPLMQSTDSEEETPT